MMYYAIRLMILALIAFAMGRVTAIEAAMWCQGQCQIASEAKSAKTAKTPDCHQSKPSNTTQKKSSGPCNHACCITIASHYYEMSSISLAGALLVKALENYPIKTVHIKSYHNNPLRPPIA
jgi:hypothetical protein